MHGRALPPVLQTRLIVSYAAGNDLRFLSIHDDQNEQKL